MVGSFNCVRFVVSWSDDFQWVSCVQADESYDWERGCACTSQLAIQYNAGLFVPHRCVLSFCSNMVTMVNRGGCSSGPIRLLGLMGGSPSVTSYAGNGGMLMWINYSSNCQVYSVCSVIVFIVPHTHTHIHTQHSLSLSPSLSLSLFSLYTHRGWHLTQASRWVPWAALPTLTRLTS
jgi:hypothetical protein